MPGKPVCGFSHSESDQDTTVSTLEPLTPKRKDFNHTVTTCVFVEEMSSFLPHTERSLYVLIA